MWYLLAAFLLSSDPTAATILFCFYCQSAFGICERDSWIVYSRQLLLAFGCWRAFSDTLERRLVWCRFMLFSLLLLSDFLIEQWGRKREQQSLYLRWRWKFRIALMQQKYSEWLCVFIRTTSSWIILSVCLTWSHLTFALQPLTGCLGVAANVHKHEVKKNSFNTLFRSEGCFIPNTLVHSKSDDSKKSADSSCHLWLEIGANNNTGTSK